MFWVRQLLRKLLDHLSTPMLTLTLHELQDLLIRTHRHLQFLLPSAQRFSPHHWERWSVLLFHYRHDEIQREVQQAFQLTLGRPTLEQLCRVQEGLLRVHFSLMGASGSNTDG